MNWQTLPYLIPYLISLVISTGVGAYAWRRRDINGAASYTLWALAQASMTLGYIFELPSPNLEAKIFWDNTQFVGMFVAPMAMLAFALQYTGRKLSHPKRVWGLLAIVPIASLLLVFTDDWHRWVRPVAWLAPGEPFSALVYDFSLSFWVMAIYAYALTLSGILILLVKFIRSRRLYRSQIGVVIVGALAPLVGSALTLMDITLTFHRDTTPLTFAIGNLVVAWGLFRYRLFDVVPVARDKVIESMGDAVMVLDTRNRLVDLNPAAQELIGQPVSEAIGQPAARVFSAWPDVVERYRDVEEAREEIVIGAGDRQRYFDLRLSPLRDRRDRLTGQLVVVRDITERKQVEGTLQRAHDELEQRVERRTAELSQANASLKTLAAQWQSTFDAVADSIGLLDLEGTFLKCNRATSGLLAKPVDEIIGRNCCELVYGAPGRVEGCPFERVRETRRRESLVFLLNGRWIEITVDPVLDENDQLIGAVHIMSDITDRKQATDALRMYTERLSILHEIDQGILAAQSPETISQAALNHIRRLIPCRRASVWLLDPITGLRAMSVVQNDGEMLEEGNVRLQSDQIGQLGEEIGAQLRRGATVIVERSRLQEEIPEPLHEALSLDTEEVHSSIAVPLIAREQLIGSLNFTVTDSQVFVEEYQDIARQVADQLAIAIQQAHLREQVQRQADELERRVADRTRELWAMYEVMTIASQFVDLETTLARSLEQVLEAVKSDEGVIHILDPEERTLRLAVHQGIPTNILPQIASLPAEGLGGWVVEHGEAILVPDITSDPRIAVRPMQPRRYFGLPMRAGGQVLGVLGILRETTQPEFGDEEIALLTSLADRVGAVVESHRLRERAEQAAVMEERQRLARDLHDSVTQSMYSVTLLAETGRLAAGARDLEVVENCLYRLGDVTQQALKEMRLLVYELRPPVLEQEGLVGALQQRLDAVENRAGVDARLRVEDEIELAASQEEAFYRIALEALNNSLKHAVASAVTVRIRADDELVSLEVADDGQGFDPQATDDTGGMGLTTMRERAEHVGGVLQVISAPGGGTKVSVTISREQEAESRGQEAGTRDR